MSAKKKAIKRSPSLESTASNIISGPGFRAAGTGIGNPEEAMELPGELYNCACALIHCTKHNRFGLQRISKSKGFFMPFVPVFPAEAMEQTMKLKLRQLLTAQGGQSKKGYVPFGQLEMLHYLRLQLPVINQHLERAVFYVKLPAANETLCCEHAPLLTWATLDEVSNRNNPAIWGIEMQVFVEAFCLANSATDRGQLTEVSLREARKHVPKSDGSKPTSGAVLVKAAGYSESDVNRIYSEFVQHCWPSQYMNLTSFDSYMTDIGFYSDDQAKKDAAHYFRAFCADQSWVSFEEFLLGWASAERVTKHGGNTGELRCGYIFRFYDFNDNRKLEYAEVSRLLFDSARSKNQPIDEAALEKMTIEAYAAMKISKATPLSLEKFKEAVGALVFRGTSNSFRTPATFRKFDRLLYPAIDENYATIADLMSGGRSSSKIKCSQCRQKKYTISSHSVTLSNTGYLMNPTPLEEQDSKKVSRDLRKQSNEFFTESLANLCLDLIREFAEASGVITGVTGKKKNANYLLSADKGKFYANFVKICDQVEEIFKQEPRVLKVQSPCHVLGDTHGNLHDLMLYERHLWKEGLALKSGSFLFLGDYVDRGQHSLEVVLYLFAQKILCPQKMFLLRGNHELRSTNRSFTFYRELEEKFSVPLGGSGQTMGHALWERFNQVFDSMPICAVIDESIFCAHGGIPTSVQNLQECNNMPCPLADPEAQFPAAWEMLWNDPINKNEYDEYVDMMRSQGGVSAAASSLMTNGFLANTKRGTAFYFSEDAIRNFFAKNGLSHVIRAHEVCQGGFQFHHRGKVITVFSSSRYGNGLNESAYVFVDQSKLRCIKFDTN
ncbi:Serine/threonine-protein phosphatase PP1 isozyme 9 [Halotydeus destructor]|nr:Serine/threonine-protein phosphatase PP1 isozyme 9 [Halotydeus destructor]